MTDYDAVLAVLDSLTIVGAVCGVGSASADLHIRVATAAVEYARATVAHREAYLKHERWRERRAADDTQEAAWRALRDAVVATLGPDE